MLLKSMAGMVTGHAGDILIGTQPLRSIGKKELERRISSQFGAYPENMADTLRHFLLLARAPFRRLLHPFSEYDRQVVDEVMRSLGLDLYRDSELGRLPGGVLKISLLAFAFARSSEILLLDNPTSGLDLHSWGLLQRALMRYSFDGEKTAVVASNDINFIAQTADRVLVLDGGTVVLDTRPEAIDSALLKRHFGVDVLVSRNIYNGKPEVHFFPGS
jgi:iron complex transport system ATP-binding protein